MKASQSYYIAKRTAFASILAYVVMIPLGCGSVAIPLVRQAVSAAPWLLYLAFAPGLLWWLATITYSLHRCPSCAKSIHTNWLGFSNPFSSSCVHCGDVVGWFSPPSNT